MCGIRLTRRVLGDQQTERLRTITNCACGSTAQVIVTETDAVIPTTLQVACGGCGFHFDGQTTAQLVTIDGRYWYDLARQASTC